MKSSGTSAISPISMQQRNKDPKAKAPSNKTLRHSDIGCDIEEYAKAKGIPFKFLKEQFKAKNSKYQGNPCVLLPYYDDNGEKVCIRKRTALTGDNKFKWNTGAILCLYCLWLLKNFIKDFVFLAEGESDCQTLCYKGFPALGVPGSNNFKDERDSQHFEKFETIYFVYEPDKGGDTLLKKLKESSIADKIMVICFKSYKDVSELYLADQKKFENRLKKAMKTAVPIAKFTDSLNHEKRDELFKECQKIAKNTNILNLFYKALQGCGVVGEKKNAKILYLALCTRFFDAGLISLIMMGNSSSGKSFIIEKTLKNFFPEDAVHILTSMSKKALIYTDRDFKHRFIWIFEKPGIADRFMDYTIRTLLSENRISYEVTVKKENGEYGTQKIDKDGPAGLILTTTSTKINNENENRCITLRTDESSAHSAEILIGTATPTKKIDTSEWLTFQRWLELSMHEVEIPYLKVLATMIPTDTNRIRRDFSKVVSLIKIHALIHQSNRKLKKGKILATTQDYRKIRRLVDKPLAESHERSIPVHLLETLKAIAGLQNQKKNRHGISCIEIAEELKIDRTTAHRRLKECEKRDYILKTSDNKPLLYYLQREIPNDQSILPSVSDLKKAIEKTRSRISSPK